MNAVGGRVVPQAIGAGWNDRKVTGVTFRQPSPHGRLPHLLLLSAAMWILSFSSLSADDNVTTVSAAGSSAVVGNPSQNEAVPETEISKPGMDSQSAAVSEAKDSEADGDNADGDEEANQTPWDYDPYKVLIWVISDDDRLSADRIRNDLQLSLARDFYALWRMEVREAPPSIKTLGLRDLSTLSYDAITAADPVFAIKKGHPEAVRLRTLDNVAEFVKKIVSDPWRSASVISSLSESHEKLADALKAKFVPLAGDELTVWKEPKTEAVLTTRGTASTLANPDAKLIVPPNADLVATQIDNFDKIFFVRVERQTTTPTVSVVEMDTLMRHFGAPVTLPLTDPSTDVAAMSMNIGQSFRPVVRIDNAGQKTATALVRGGGLIIRDDSPGRIHEGDILEPMVRKDDRNGTPFVIGPMDWAFLVATEADNRVVKMDFWSGRAGGLQGRKNNRTFKMGLRVKPRGRGSLLRLHAKGDENKPLIGYEIYEKALDSKEMTFVGRTDWNGRLQITPSDGPFRLLYVKNGSAVLARLPIVPGLHDRDVANLVGDDDRLQAEAYIRGVQSSIIDLVALRELFKARVRMRLERGEMEKAEELMVALRKQPGSKELNDAIGKKQVMFLRSIDNKSQKMKVDSLFSSTQELLSKFINPKLVQDLETDMITAKKNGGRLAAQKKAEDSE